MKVNSFISGLFTNILKTITNEDFRQGAKETPCAFTRKRKFDFKDIVITLLGFGKSGIQVEIDRFFKTTSLDNEEIVTYTKAAFSKARQKIKPKAFITLKNEQLTYFEQNAPVNNTWMGYRVISIDGSSLNLPQHECLENHFGSFKNQSGVSSPCARISIAYDTGNHLVLDGQIANTQVGEQELAKKHTKYLTPQSDLLLFDRGYPSLAFAMDLNDEGFHFCFRLSTAWKEAYRLLESEVDVDWSLEQGKRYKGEDNKQCYLKQDVKGFRLVKIELGDGQFEVLLTNLCDRNLFSLNTLKKLYHLRWSVEECYKRIKQVGQIEFFSGFTPKAIEQDFHARIVMLNLAAMIEMQELQPKLNKVKAQRNCKHELQVNRTQVSAKVKDFFYDIFYKFEPEKSIAKMLKLLINAYDIVRDNRKFKRNKGFKYKRKPLMYKAF